MGNSTKRRDSKTLALSTIVSVVFLTGAHSANSQDTGETSSGNYDPETKIYWSEFWSGEWPPGFTMTDDVTMNVHSRPAADSSRSVACTFKKGATYHPWNQDRIEKDYLKFLTSQQTIEHIVNAAVNAYVSDPQTDEQSRLKVKKGDRWTFLTYYAEGFFLMSFNGKEYVAEQDLYENSSPADPNQSTEDSYEEWLSLPCDNKANGWLLLSDIAGNDKFGEPNVSEYGVATDK